MSMASMNDFELKSIKKTEGRQGKGFISSIYVGAEKIGTACDFGDGLGMKIDIPKAGNQVAFTFTAEDYVKKYLHFTDEKVKENRKYTEELFIEKLIELHDLEKIYKKGIKRHHSKSLALADVKKKSDIVRPVGSEPIYESVGTFISPNANISTDDMTKQLSSQGVTFDRIDVFRSLKEFNFVIEDIKIQAM